MGGAVRELDRQVVPQMDDSGRQELGQMGRVVERLLRLPTGVVGLFEGVPDPPLHVVGVRCARRLTQALERPPT